MPTLTVSVGRNLGLDDKLDDAEWYDFRQSVAGIVDKFGVVRFEATGAGTDSVSGGIEESYTVVGTVMEYDLPELEQRLIEIGQVFGQREVAVTPGTTRFLRTGVA